MKSTFFTLMVVCTVVYPSAQVRPSKRDLRRSINSAADKLLKRVNKYMQENNLDPHPLANARRKVAYRPFLVEFSGILDLTRGRVKGISQMKRGGDVFVTNTRSKILVELPIKCDEINFRYHYVLTILGVGTRGEVYGKIAGSRIDILAEVEAKNYHINLLKLELVKPGKMSMSFSGNILWDWFTNKMTEVISVFMGDEIKQTFSTFVKREVEAYISNINNYTANNRKETDEFVKKTFEGLKL